VLAEVLVAQRSCRIWTNAIVVEISRSSVLFKKRSKTASSGVTSAGALPRRAGR
jgi:hypothetical protein